MGLSPKELRLIYYLVYTDLKEKEICAKLNVAKNYPFRCREKAEFQEELRREMLRGFNDIALKARRKLEELMECGNPSVQFAACKEILNKAGYKEVEQSSVQMDATIYVDYGD